MFFCHILVLSVSVWKLILKRWVGPGLIYRHELYFQLHWLCEAVLSQLTEHIEINQDELQYLRVRYFTLLLYPYDYRSCPDRMSSITACSSQENNFSSWKNHLCFYGAASDQYNNTRNLYTCHSLRTLLSPSGLIISYKMDHIHLWHEQYSFITTHSLGFNNWCVSCFQTAFNCSVSPSISVRVFRRSTPLCRSVELHWVRTRKGFRISLSTAWLVRLHTHHCQHPLESSRHVGLCNTTTFCVSKGK